MIIQKFKKKQKDFQLNYGVHESLVIGTLLSMVGGMLDAHTFLFRNKIFANTQTGNIVFLALELIDQNFKIAFNHVCSMFAFIVGIFLTELCKSFYKNSQIRFFNLVLILEIVSLSAISLIKENKLNILVITTISFVCSLQTNSFRSLKGSLYASTMCTGNLRSAAANFINFVAFHKKKHGYICLQYLIILFSFFAGVVGGKILTEYYKQFTLIFCCLFLAVALVIINLKKTSKNRSV